MAIDHGNNNNDGLSLSSSTSTISSTIVKFYNFGGNVAVSVFDRATGNERPNVIVYSTIPILKTMTMSLIILLLQFHPLLLLLLL